MWHYAKGSVTHGPVASAELKRLASTGQLSRQDMIWKEGMKEWRPAGDVQGLFGDAQSAQQSPQPRGGSAAGDIGVARGPQTTDTLTAIADRLSSATGVEKLKGFSLSEMFSETFSRHSPDDVERYFNVGGPDTTPAIEAVNTGWPKPWAFFRTLGFAGILYAGLFILWVQFKNPFLIPGMILIGSFAVPLATCILFFELNVRKNVSLFQTIKLVLLGGVLSLVATHFNHLFVGSQLAFLGYSAAGLTEEPAKILALLLLLNDRRYPYILNGLLFGAAVGAGFAAFESAGYAFVSAADGADAMVNSLLVRGLLAPFMHIAWTAMSAAALWRVKGASRFRFSMLLDPCFLRVFAAAIALHMVWNSEWQIPAVPILKHVILGVIAWVIVLGLVQEGLREVGFEKQAKLTRA